MIKLGTGILAAFGVIAAPVAASSLTTAASVQGNAYIVRDGVVSPASAIQSLRVGDRVFTRIGSTARVSGNGCSQTIGSGSMAMVTSNTCAGLVNAASLGQVGQGDSADDGESGTTSFLISALAVAAAGLGLYVALNEEDDDRPDDLPVSV